MFAILHSAHNSLKGAIAVIATLTLASCEPTVSSGPSTYTGDPIAVALLLPSGSEQSGDALLAESLENAARLAISDLDGVQIDLRVYETGGDANTAATLAATAVNEGAKIILGPVYAESANAAGVAVAPANVNVLSFSNNTAIAGGNVFVLGQTFQNTANRLTQFVESQGKQRVLTVYADNLAGKLGNDAISNGLAETSVTNIGSVPYAFSQEGVVQAVSTVRDEAELGNADTLFLTADTSGALPLFSQMLPEAGLTPETIQYAGLTRWDIPSQTLTLPGVQGGWFALPDPALSQRFRDHYQAAYGGQPHPIGGLAYDGIAAIGALIKTGKSDQLTTSALTQRAGFKGVSGIFRLRADGTNERGLAVATIEDKQVVVIDPAPRRFGGAGF